MTDDRKELRTAAGNLVNAIEDDAGFELAQVAEDAG